LKDWQYLTLFQGRNHPVLWKFKLDIIPIRSESKFIVSLLFNLKEGYRMGKYIVTTFGKWEEQRKQLVAELLSNAEIAAKINKEKIEQVLFDDVNSAMVEMAYSYSRANYPKVGTGQITLRDMTLQAYKLSLTVVLNSLSNALAIDEAELEPFVARFNAACENALDKTLMDISMDIGQASINSKGEATKQLYGETFAVQYKDLAQQLQLQDPDLIAIAKEFIKKTIKPENYGDRAENVKQQLIYMDQIAPKITTSNEFAELFLKRTGKTMQEYKDAVAANKPSAVWEVPAAAVVVAPVEQPKINFS
jgi:hypothetical protein